MSEERRITAYARLEFDVFVLFLSICIFEIPRRFFEGGCVALVIKGRVLFLKWEGGRGEGEGNKTEREARMELITAGRQYYCGFK